MGLDIGDHEILSSEQAFDGRVVKVFLDDVRLPDGRKARWERVAHPGAVGIVPLLEDLTVLMVKQYRHAVGGVLLEIPAGKLDRDEPPWQTAHRELAEEVNMKAGEMLKLAEFYNSPGYSDEYFHLYLARGLTEEEGEPEPDEFLEVERVSLDGAIEMISSGAIVDAKSIIGLTLTHLLLNGETSLFRGMRTHEP